MAEIRTLKDGTPPVFIGHFGSCARNIMVHHPPRVIANQPRFI